MAQLDGLSAIVTGAAQGIGLGIARVLLAEGARVAITDVNDTLVAETAAALAADGSVIGLHHDVAIEASCTAVAARVRDAFGQIDILVNNAGISERTRIEDIDGVAWDRTLAVNLRGVHLTTHAVLPHMRTQGGGRIVNVASLAGRVGLPLSAHYSASKFGVVGYTQALAAELASEGIRVNAVCPGVVRTPMWTPELRDIAAEQGISVEDAWRDALASIPLGRPQEPEDIGHAVAFLVSDRARNVTGETLNVNGGQRMD